MCKARPDILPVKQILLWAGASVATTGSTVATALVVVAGIVAIALILVVTALLYAIRRSEYTERLCKLISTYKGNRTDNNDDADGTNDDAM